MAGQNLTYNVLQNWRPPAERGQSYRHCKHFRANMVPHLVNLWAVVVLFLESLSCHAMPTLRKPLTTRALLHYTISEKHVPKAALSA